MQHNVSPDIFYLETFPDLRTASFYAASISVFKFAIITGPALPIEKCGTWEDECRDECGHITFLGYTFYKQSIILSLGKTKFFKKQFLIYG